MPIVPLPGTSEKLPESEEVEVSKYSDFELLEWYYAFVRAFMDCDNWKCPECGTINFGRNAYCPYCKQRLGKMTTRPPGTGCETKQQWK